MPEMSNPTGKHRRQHRRHGEGAIFHRPGQRRNLPWCGVLSMGIDPATGKRIRRWYYASSREAVEAMLADAARRRHTGPDMLLADWIATWLDAQRETLRPWSHRRYADALAHVSASLGRVRLALVTEEQIRVAMRSWALSPAGRGFVLERLRSAFAAAQRRGFVADNPALLVAKPRATVRTAPTIGAAEARRLLDAAAESPWGPFVVLALTTGLRRGELLGLRWNDREGDVLHVRRQLRPVPLAQRSDGKPVALVPLKTKRAERSVSLPPIARAALDEQEAHQADARRAARVWAENGLVFADSFGQPIMTNEPTRAIPKIAVAAGLGHVRLHDLRHGFATLMAAGGIHPRVAQELLGHATAQQSMEYTHVVDDAARLAADAIERAVGR